MKINVHFERLVLEGLPMDTQQAQIVAKALQAGLEQRIAHKEPALWTRRPSMAGDSVRSPLVVLQASKAEQLGRQIAHSVSTGLDRFLGDSK